MSLLSKLNPVVISERDKSNTVNFGNISLSFAIVVSLEYAFLLYCLLPDCNLVIVCTMANEEVKRTSLYLLSCYS